MLQLGGKYLLYYTASDTRKNMQCIGVAVASDPLGPFVDDRAEPIVCQTGLGGSIDASPFRDSDGKLYLYFKNDGNRVHARTSLWGQPLAADGLSVTGQATELAQGRPRLGSPRRRSADHGPLAGGVRAVLLGRLLRLEPRGGRAFALRHGLCQLQRAARSVHGGEDNPILHSFNDREAGCLSGPGHQSIFTRGAAQPSSASMRGRRRSGCRKVDDRRYLYVAPIFWKDGKPQIGPSLR